MTLWTHVLAIELVVKLQNKIVLAWIF